MKSLNPAHQAPALEYVPDPVIRVRHGSPDNWQDWYISQNLTSRWGKINQHDSANKPLALLEGNPVLLARLRAQMWQEETFIVRKDGHFGVLFEVEFLSQQSEAHLKDDTPEWYAKLKQHDVVVEALLKGLNQLEESFPEVQFAVPDEAEARGGRPAVWAFVRDGLLTEKRRNELGYALVSL